MRCVGVGARMLLHLRLHRAVTVTNLALVMVPSLVVALGGLLLCSTLARICSLMLIYDVSSWQGIVMAGGIGTEENSIDDNVVTSV
jgi:hypothetical protein